MITRLEVDGFKSLRGFAIDLEPFTVLIGPNGAGKSNVLEAIGLLSRLKASAPEDALKGGRGRASDQFSRYRSEAVREMRFGVETLEPDSVRDGLPEEVIFAHRKRYDILLAQVSARAIEHVELQQRVRYLLNKDDRWLATHPEWARLARDFLSEDEAKRENEHLPFLGLAEFGGMNLRESSDRIDSGKLAADGSNLPSVLASLSDDQLAEIRAELAGLVPGVANFEIVESEDAYRVEFHMHDGDIVPARLISSGTLRVLALLTAIYSRQTWSSILCIEEPENGIYPGRLRRFIELLLEVTDSQRWREEQRGAPPPQVIVATHSPVFLAALREHPQHLRYIDTVQRGKFRATRARPVGAEEGRDTISMARIASVLEDVTRGEEDR